eukprot:SAG31_NODE_1154_length_9635_cov_3.552118_2_plen_82_part_00
MKAHPCRGQCDNGDVNSNIDNNNNLMMGTIHKPKIHSGATRELACARVLNRTTRYAQLAKNVHLYMLSISITGVAFADVIF